MVNSLAQLVLKLASPGVPDFYQGTELWDLSLVDPDNRRPVDYGLRAAMLAELEPWLDETKPPPSPEQGGVARWLANWHDGRIKLFLTACGLRLRKQLPRVFLEGEYIPITAEGARADHVVAFARRLGAAWVVAVVPRLVASLVEFQTILPVRAEVWGETRLHLPREIAATALRNVFTGEAVALNQGGEAHTILVADVLSVCPVALIRGGSIV